MHMLKSGLCTEVTRLLLDKHLLPPVTSDYNNTNIETNSEGRNSGSSSSSSSSSNGTELCVNSSAANTVALSIGYRQMIEHLYQPVKPRYSYPNDTTGHNRNHRATVVDRRVFQSFVK